MFTHEIVGFGANLKGAVLFTVVFLLWYTKCRLLAVAVIIWGRPFNLIILAVCWTNSWTSISIHVYSFGHTHVRFRAKLFVKATGAFLFMLFAIYIADDGAIFPVGILHRTFLNIDTYQIQKYYPADITMYRYMIIKSGTNTY